MIVIPPATVFAIPEERTALLSSGSISSLFLYEMSQTISNNNVVPQQQTQTFEQVKAALKDQVKFLRAMKSNIRPSTIDSLEFLEIILETNEGHQRMMHLSLKGLFQVLDNPGFYLPFASRTFDRIFARTERCNADTMCLDAHLHNLDCIKYSMRGSADWVDMFPHRPSLVCRISGSDILTMSQPELDQALPQIVDPMVDVNDMPIDLTKPDQLADSLKNLGMNAAACSPQLTEPSFGPLVDFTEHGEHGNANYSSELPNYAYASNFMTVPRSPCYECSKIRFRRKPQQSLYHEFGHAISILGQYGVEWRWRSISVPPPFRLNSGEMKKQREIDLAVRSEKKKKHMLVVAWDKLDKREAPKRSVKERNRLFRESCDFHCNGLLSKAKTVMKLINQTDDVLAEVTSTVEKIKSVKDTIKTTIGRMLPNLAMIFARWLVQPPNFWAMMVDLLSLVHNVFPEKVKYTFDQLLLKTQSYIQGLRSGPIDAKTGSSSKRKLTEEERDALEARYLKGEFKMNGRSKSEKDEENLTKAGFLTLIADLLTGIRMKDRAKWTLEAAMSFGKTMRDINTYRKATLEIVNTVVSFFGRYIKCAMWQKMFDTVPSTEDLAKFVMEVEAIQAYSDSDLDSPDFPAQMDRLWKTAVEVRRILVTHKLDTTQSQQLNVACGALSRFRARHFVRIQRHLAAVRTVPFVVSLVGASGVHKSDTATLLAKDMCHPGNCNMDIGSSDPGELIYFHGGLKFCDTYCGQPVWFWDDIFQKKATESTSTDDDEYVKFIKYISNAQIVLPMAQVDEKGRYLTSPLFITTSNVLYPIAKSVQDSEAVQRRRNILCYVTVDKSYVLYPQEAISYDLPDGTQYAEQALQYMQFHILPSTQKNGPVTVGDTMLTQPLPQHGAATGMCYTDFLETCVVQFNEWQNTASTARMYAKTPAKRVFGMGAPLLSAKVHDRMNPHNVDVKMPKMNGGRISKSVPPTKPQNPFGGALFKDEDVDSYQNFDEDVTFDRDQYDNVDMTPQILPEIEQLSYIDRFMAKHETLAQFGSMIADFLGMPLNFVLKFCRVNAKLFMFAALVGFVSAFACAYKFVLSKNELDSLVPADARKQFIEACHPLIQDEMDNLLTETTLDLEHAKLRANMSAQGYDRQIMKGKAAKVITREAHLERMRATINAHMNAGHANNVATETVIYNNIRSICLKDGQGFMQAIGVCGHYMVVNNHFFQYARKLEQIKDGKCWIRIGMNGRDCWSGEIDMQLVRFYDNDVAVFKLPKQCHSFRDIRKHFVTKNKFTVANKVPVRLMSTTSYTRIVQAHATLRCQELRYDDENQKDIVAIVMDWYEVSHTDLTKGDCGAPMFLDQLNLIAGIHAASNGTTGIVVPVWREMFDHCTEPYQIEDCPEPIEQVFANGKGAVDPVGLVPAKWANFVLDKTDIKPSPICGVVAEVQKEPSVKSLKDVRISDEARKGEEPIWKSFQQYFDPVHDIPERLLRKAHIAVVAVLSLVKPTESLGRRILSEEEVLNGTRDGTFPSLNIHTSAGMPQRTYAPGKPGKTAFFERNADDSLRWGTSIPARKFRKDYEHYENCLKWGIIPFVMLQEQLKDETLKKSKINDAKTRTFEVFPGPLALVFRKYFGAFNAAVQKEHASKPISVGINPHSVAWQILYQRLNRFGGKVIAGDYVAWDKRLCGQAIFEAVEIINEWYDLDDSIPVAERSKNNEVRLLLAVILVHSNVVVQRIMYQTEQGLPSGVPITSVLNSVANWLYLYSAIFQVLESKGQYGLLPHELNEHVELALYGDDHIVALSAKLREFVTFRDIRDVFTERRVGYTDANKNTYSDFDFEQLTDVTFLKRKFQPEGGRVYAPLDKVSVEDQLNWINENKQMNDFAILAQCFNGFQIEAHLHGKEYFDSMMTKLRNALREHPNELRECALVKLSNSEYKDHWEQYNDQYSQV